MSPTFEKGDALLIVDVQRDFLPGGALAVARGDEVVPALNRYIALAARKAILVFASRDWHPQNHCSFHSQGGMWPPHCVTESDGAQFAPGLRLPADAVCISKGTDERADAYSAFAGTDLHRMLKTRGVQRVWIGGLATDYCVLESVLDARKAGYAVFFLEDASRAVDAHPADGARAIARMREAGAVAVKYDDIEA